jgi:hypothetical protein
MKDITLNITTETIPAINNRKYVNLADYFAEEADDIRALVPPGIEYLPTKENMLSVTSNVVTALARIINFVGMPALTITKAKEAAAQLVLVEPKLSPPFKHAGLI